MLFFVCPQRASANARWGFSFDQLTSSGEGEVADFDFLKIRSYPAQNAGVLAMAGPRRWPPPSGWWKTLAAPDPGHGTRTGSDARG